MVPKNETLTRTDVPVKELSWIDRMYQKLENMCVEVDKNPTLLLQETSKYMESQMNVVGTNVRQLCAELIQDLLPQPILSSEVAVKKPEPAVLCNCDCAALEKPKLKSATKTWEINDGAIDITPEDIHPEDIQGKAEDHSDSLGQTAFHEDTGSEGLEIDCSRLGGLTTQRETVGKVEEYQGDANGLEGSPTQPVGIGQEVDTVMKRFEKCASSHDAQKPVKDAELAAEEEMDEMQMDSNSTVSSNAGSLKENDHKAASTFFVEQEDADQEQTARWLISEDHRKLYTAEKSSLSSFNPFDGDPQLQGALEDFESDWELV